MAISRLAPVAWSRPTGSFGRWTVSISTSPRARCSVCSVPTAPARPPRSRSSPPSPSRRRVASVAGFDVVRDAASAPPIGLVGQNAAVDANLTGRENLPGRPALRHRHARRRERRGPRAARPLRPQRRRRPPGQDLLGRHAPPPRPGRRAGARPPSCSWTSPPPGWTRAAGPELWETDRGAGRRRHRPSCSPRSTWTRPTVSPTRSR